ncbi:EAL domain-containing protein [Massilia sp. 2TAF26]|uniref:EAL domain-containing protein n=1 Tax=Massilia sp. 2TAF26 TaxID=3233012 RepID=UPI003F982623
MTESRFSHDNDIDILIVEDSVTQARLLAQLLQAEGGYRVRTAANGREGLAAARAARPTMILSDISMPEMDGFEMCKEIKRDPALRDIPVILLTSLSSLYDVIKGLDAGADNFIRKPYESSYLLGRMRFILANRALRSNDRVQLGMQVNLGGQTHFITAERQQIFDLLISTYEDAIHMTEQLKVQQARIAHSYQSLESLYRIAEALNPALSEPEVAERALQRVLELPGVLDATIWLADGEGRLRLMGRAGDGGCAGDDCACEQALCDAARCAVREPGSSAHQRLLVPLASGAHTRGMLCMSTATALSDDERQVLETVGNQIAVAIERAHLYTHMEGLVRERTTALESERALLSAVVNNSGALVVVLDPQGVVRIFNSAAERSYGWLASEVVGRNFRDFVHQADDQPLSFDLPTDHGVPVQSRREWYARDGSIITLIWSTTWLRDATGAPQYFVATGIDVTELRGAEERVRYLSNFDPETGLPNEVLLRDRLRQMQARAMEGQQVLGYLLLELPRLLMVKASLGLDAERAVLKQAAERLGRWSQGDATVARTGQRVFAIVALRQNAAELGALARQVLAEMEQAFDCCHQELHVDPCIGIAMFPNDGDDYDTLAQGAEAALQRALASKAARYEFHRPDLNDGMHERFRLEAALRRALEREELRVHYQPQVSLSTGAIIGVEALLRWQHPDLGLTAPGRFIGLAEETGLILPIGEWVLRKACEQLGAWQRAGLRPVPVSVNLSARQFSGHIAVTVGRILAESGIDPALLELELTESASMEDPQKTVDILRQLKDMGVRLAIDDFGTGYSNLNYLKRFPVDKLKLDQSFVRDITSDPDDLSISRAVIAMAHGLRLAVIAEGVETAGQLALLAENGCDEMQGYFFSRPVDAEACARLLREDRSLDLSQLLRAPYQRTLLYVDDEVNLLSAVRRQMRHAGYQVLVASNAEEAYEILAKTRVGVILCDQRLRGMSGTEFLSRVKHMYPDTVRMVLSGYTDLHSVTEAVNRGAIFKFLTKPWLEEDLAAAVRDAFAEFETKRSPLQPRERA